MNGIIAHRDGRVYVAVTDTDWAEPKRWTVYYPVEAYAGVFDEGAQALYCHNGYDVEIDLPGERMRFVRCAGGTLPDKRYTTSEDIPRPRTRLETRWRDGRWQKLKKNGFWVDA